MVDLTTRMNLQQQAAEARIRAEKQAKEAKKQAREQRSATEQQAEAAKARLREQEARERRKLDLPFTKPQVRSNKDQISAISEYQESAKAQQRKYTEAVSKAETEAIENINKQEKDALAQLAAYEKQAEQAKAEVAKAEAEWKSSHVELDTGEWVTSDLYNSLNKEQQDYLVKNGVDAFNKNIESERKAFEDSNIVIGDTYISKEEWDKIDPKYRAIAIKDGFVAMNATIEQDNDNLQKSIDNINEFSKSDGTITSAGIIAAVQAGYVGDLIAVGITPEDIQEAWQVEKEGHEWVLKKKEQFAALKELEPFYLTQLAAADKYGGKPSDYPTEGIYDVLPAVWSGISIGTLRDAGFENPEDIINKANEPVSWQYFKAAYGTGIKDEPNKAYDAYIKQYGLGTWIASQYTDFASGLFPPAKALHPEITIDDVTASDWVWGAATVYLLAGAPGLASVLKGAASAVKVTPKYLQELATMIKAERSARSLGAAARQTNFIEKLKEAAEVIKKSLPKTETIVPQNLTAQEFDGFLRARVLNPKLTPEQYKLWQEVERITQKTITNKELQQLKKLGGGSKYIESPPPNELFPQVGTDYLRSGGKSIPLTRPNWQALEEVTNGKLTEMGIVKKGGQNYVRIGGVSGAELAEPMAFITGYLRLIPPEKALEWLIANKQATNVAVYDPELMRALYNIASTSVKEQLKTTVSNELISKLETGSLAAVSAQAALDTGVSQATIGKVSTTTSLAEALGTSLAQATKTSTATDTALKTKSLTSTKTLLKTPTKLQTKTTTKTTPTKFQTKYGRGGTKIKVRIPSVTTPSGELRPMTAEELAGAVAWKQGLFYIMIYPPYGEKNIEYSKSPFVGVKVYSGARSAYQSIAKIGGKLPRRITRDLGIMDITITTSKRGIPEIKFQADLKQKTTLTKKHTRKPKKDKSYFPSVGFIRG